MDLSLNDLEKHFNVKKEEGALLFVFLTLLAPGGCITFLNGRIEKVSEDTLKLRVDESTYHLIANDFLTEEVDDYDQIYSSSLVEQEEEDNS